MTVFYQGLPQSSVLWLPGRGILEKMDWWALSACRKSCVSSFLLQMPNGLGAWGSPGWMFVIFLVL